MELIQAYYFKNSRVKDKGFGGLNTMIIIIIISIMLIIFLAFYGMFSLRTDEDIKSDDEAQLKYLEEYRKNKPNKRQEKQTKKETQSSNKRRQISLDGLSQEQINEYYYLLEQENNSKISDDTSYLYALKCLRENTGKEKKKGKDK